ncbi:MAG: Na/Pi cotransporter family protein [Bacteroidaceae bacterium]|nr:Na/Pi cotransporter family protein [Bacteroidaceae bacterium]
MEQNYMMIGIKLLGALGLLIYGMKMMSEALQKMAGSQLRHILGRMTTNRLTGMLTGTFVTCAVQSSSATTVMTVSFVSAGLLTLGQAISVIMGANIGTTLTAWIMSLGYNVDLTAVVFPAFLVGMVLIYKKRHRYVGDFLFGIGFMFLSLVMLSNGGRELDLEHNPAVVEFFASFDTDSYLTILAFLGIGTLITGIVQSSAAVMAITIMLCSTGVLPIHLGIALVMGENIGTTATANLAALGANTQARRAALAHLLFNVFGVIWVLIVFFPFTDLVCRLAGYDPQVADPTRLPIVLATFHTCFNLSNTMLLIGFIPQIERIVCRLLPERQQPEAETFRLKYIQSNLVQTPEISVMQAQKETADFAQRVEQMFGMVCRLEEEEGSQFDRLYDDIVHEEDIADRTEIEIARFLEDVSRDHLSDVSKAKVRQIMREISELESIGDACYKLARTINRRHVSHQKFPPVLSDKLQGLMFLTQRALKQMNTVVSGRRSQQDINDTYRLADEVKEMNIRLKVENISDVDDKQYSYPVGALFADMTSQCQMLVSYVVNVVEARLKP